MLLAGDVGGTKTRIALFSADGVTQIAAEQYQSGDFPDLESLIETFLALHSAALTQPIQSACFGIPGPVINGYVRVTNLPWEIAEQKLRTKLGVRSLLLVNDLVATAAGASTLPPDAVVTLYPGKGAPTSGQCSLLVAPGTGLGHAIIVEGVHRVEYLASEAGHMNFAPATSDERDLLVFVEQRTGHPRVESLVSGPGIGLIHDFLVAERGCTPPQQLSGYSGDDDLPALVTRHAIERSDNGCVRTMAMFCRIFGAHTSNMLLATLATRGVMLGGGVPPRILPLLQRGEFVEGYLAKSKCREQVEATPVSVIMNDLAALRGAAALARRAG
jgi:glucokinase